MRTDFFADSRVCVLRSLRALFGTDGRRNAVHGSDSLDNAQRELDLVFNKFAAEQPQTLSVTVSTPSAAAMAALAQLDTAAPSPAAGESKRSPASQTAMFSTDASTTFVQNALLSIKGVCEAWRSVQDSCVAL